MIEAKDLLDLAVRVARGAGDILLERSGKPATGVDTKTSATDPVSDADRASEQYLLGSLAAERPDDGVLAEEGGAEGSSSGLRWVIDPLDGTVNYLYRIPVWCVSIAVEDERGALVGVVHDPNRAETFSAIRGEGAFLNAEPINVGRGPILDEALIGTGFSYDAQARVVQAGLAARVIPAARDIRRSGSAALDLVAVACGRLDGFFEAPMEPWDKAAGLLIATEAGARSSELPPPREGLSPGLIVAPEALHRALRELLLA